MGHTVGDHYMQSFTILHEIAFLWLQGLKPNQGKTNTNRQTKKKTKTPLNSATAVKQSNHQEEFGSAAQATLTGRFPPHSYSAPPHMARVEDGEPWFEFAGCCQFVSQSECYLNAVWGFLGQWIIL